jgi:hypothetical protein
MVSSSTGGSYMAETDAPFFISLISYLFLCEDNNYFLETINYLFNYLILIIVIMWFGKYYNLDDYFMLSC